MIASDEIVVESARRLAVDETLRRSAARRPGRAAVVGGATAWTYRELDELVSRIATGLERSGIAAGDRVALLARNSHWFVALRYALSRAGAVFVPINFMLSAEEIAYIITHSGASRLFVDGGCADAGLAASRLSNVTDIWTIPDLADHEPTVAGARAFSELHDRVGVGEPRNHPIAQIIYTSGTESRPKGAVLTHEAVLCQYQSCIEACDWREEAIVANALPLFHCAQLDAILGPSLQVAATNVVFSDPAPATLIPAIERYGITSAFAPPTSWIALLRSPLLHQTDLSSVTHGYYGASIMPVEVLRELMRELPAMRLWNLYGQTEIAPVATVLRPEDQIRKAGSIGRAVINVMTRVVDEMMTDVEIGSTGEIVHRSPQLLSGYWNDPEATARAFEGGWFHSGDLATIDAEGYMTVVDRKKDVIKSGGENVSSREVEEIIYQLDGVSEVAVVGLPDPRWIEAVTAFVVVKSGASIGEATVVDHCRRSLAGYKTPKQVHFLANLPRNASGKILKRELRNGLPEAKSKSAPSLVSGSEAVAALSA